MAKRRRTAQFSSEADDDPIAWIQAKLREAAEPKYAVYLRGIIPKDVASPIMGVKVGFIHKLVAQLSDDACEKTLHKVFFSKTAAPMENVFPYSLEERLVVAFIIGRVDATFDRRVELIEAFLPWIDSWAVCDEFATVLKWRANERNELLDYISMCLARSEPYTIRFALVEIIKWFITPTMIDFVIESIETLAKRNLNERVVQTACSWTLTEAFVKFPETTMQYLRNNSLDDFTYNLTLRKIGDSLRVDLETKLEIRNMTRPRKRGK